LLSQLLGLAHRIQGGFCGALVLILPSQRYKQSFLRSESTFSLDDLSFYPSQFVEKRISVHRELCLMEEPPLSPTHLANDVSRSGAIDVGGIDYIALISDGAGVSSFTCGCGARS
jgi:hypothetical protein